MHIIFYIPYNLRIFHNDNILNNINTHYCLSACLLRKLKKLIWFKYFLYQSVKNTQNVFLFAIKCLTLFENNSLILPNFLDDLPKTKKFVLRLTRLTRVQGIKEYDKSTNDVYENVYEVNKADS